jgi:hypothetical protein
MSDHRRVTLDLGNCNERQRTWVLTLGRLLCEGDNFRQVIEGRAILAAAPDASATIQPYPVNALNHPPVT